MPKRKVIEDSDDEANAETTPPRHRGVALPETNAGTAIVSEDSSGWNDVQQSADPSTGSTEVLNRDIRAAHKSLIDPTLDGSLIFTKNVSASQEKSQPSPTVARAKIKRAKTAVEKPRTKKPLKKYGTESNRDVFEFHTDNDGEMEGSSDKVVGSRNIASSRGLSTGQTVALEDAGLFRVRPEARNKPGMNCMPPPTSKSTSQTQTSETITVATSADKDPAESTPSKPMATEEPGGFEPTSSESRMPDPTMSSRGRGEGDQAADMNSMKGSGNLLGLDRDATVLELVEPSSSASAPSPSKIITVDRRYQGPQPLTEDGGISIDEPSAALPVDYTPEQVRPVVPTPELSYGHEVTDELLFPSHGPETWSINQTTVYKAREWRNDDMPAEEPGSEDAAIGLPKEQYQPRPSRSRSGRGAEEVIVPADFSKRPEAAVKKKSRVKRSKTTAFHELRAKSDVDEEEDTIDYKPTMEAIEKIPTREFEKREELDSNKQGTKINVDEGTHPKPITNAAEKKKQRGRPKKGVTEAPESKVSRDIDTNGLQVDMESGNIQHPAPARTAKTGTKAKQAPLAHSEELVHDSDDELGDVDNMIRNSSKVLSETQGNGTTLNSVGKAAAVAPAKAIDTPPQTPRKADTPAQKGPDKHSPISSGKVAYRVGLSKRARIAPLLRMVRKA